MILYRPVGTKELELIKESDYEKYPPRLPEQPIFYPVLNEKYAAEIASQWNVKYNDDHRGYVTRFEIDDEYSRQFEVHTVGAGYHQELWVPAEELETFNRHIIGKIQVISEYAAEEKFRLGGTADMVTIRLAVEQDYDAVERIMKQVQNMHVGWRPDIYIDADPVLPHDMYLAHLAEGQVIVAEVAGEVVGLVIYLTRHISGGPMKERKVLFVDSMAVEEQYRGQGIGHKLFDYILQLCQKQQYDGLELQVNARNAAARAMYEKYGFTEKSINMEFLGL